MTRCFGPGALSLAGLTARMLGWHPDQFWAATPAELAAILSPGLTDGQPLSRTDLSRMMERDNDRSGRHPDA